MEAGVRRLSRVGAVLLLGACVSGGDDSVAPTAAEEPAIVPESCLGEADGPVLYLMPDAPDGGDGSAAHPYAELQDAMDAAENGTEIRMAPGVYPHGGGATDPTRHQGLVVKACETGTVDIWDAVVFAGRTSVALADTRLEGVHVGGLVVAVRAQPMTFADIGVTYDLAGIVLEESTVRFEGSNAVTFNGGVELGDGFLPTAVDAHDAEITITGDVTVVDTALGYGWTQYRGSLTVDGALSVDCHDCTLAAWLGDAPTTVRGTLTTSGGGDGLQVGYAAMEVEAGGQLEAAGGTGAGILVYAGATLALDSGGYARVGASAGWGLVVIDDGWARIDGTLTIGGEGPEASLQVQAGRFDMGTTGVLVATGGGYGLWSLDGGSATLTTASFSDADQEGIRVDGGASLHIAGPVQVAGSGSTGVRVYDSSDSGLDLGGSVTIEDSAGMGLIVHNSAWAADGPVTVTGPGDEGVRVEESTAAFAQLDISGAVYTGLHARGSTVTVTGGTIAATDAQGFGDGVLLDGGTLTLDGVALIDNPRAGVLVTHGTGTVADSTISGGAWSVVQSDCVDGKLVVTGLDASGSDDTSPHLCDGAVSLSPAP